jgi:glucan 1,3-beta-glucosidase
MTLIDSVIKDTPIGVSMDRNTTSATPAAGSLILENVKLINVATAIQGPQGSVLAGSAGTTTIAAWGQGNSYTPTGHTSFQGPITANARPPVLTAGADYYERSKPQYESYPASAFVSVRDFGAKGDGKTDDTAALTAAINKAVASDQILYFDAGDYLVSSTLYIPSGSFITGEAYPVILASGSSFTDMNNPTPVVQVGKPGEKGTVQWSDMIISTKGPQEGAILIEWNLDATGETPAGMWDVHTRIGGFTGSDLQVGNCPTGPFDSRNQNTTVTAANIPKQCIAAFLSLHVTKSATGLYMENVWLWVADHDADDAAVTQISVYAGRGLLVESQAGVIWMYGTAVEHHSLYQYQFANTKDIFMGQIQTETPYYQPNPNTAVPFPAVGALNDPAPAASALGLRVLGSSDILIYSAGLYSFFYNYNVHCSDQGNGEWCQPRIFSVEESSVSLYNLNTVGTQNMIAVDGTDIASYTDNIAGFIDTIAIFRS